MKQTTSTLNGHTIHMVDVPEGSYDIRIVGKTLEGYKKTGCIYWDRELPHGNWKPLGLASDIKEEIAAGLVEHFNKVVRGYKDYTPGTRYEQLFATAVASLHSFVKSNNFNPETTVILIKE